MEHSLVITKGKVKWASHCSTFQALAGMALITHVTPDCLELYPSGGKSLAPRNLVPGILGGKEKKEGREERGFVARNDDQRCGSDMSEKRRIS